MIHKLFRRRGVIALNALLLPVCAMLMLRAVPTVHAQTVRCFDDVPAADCLEGRFLEFWDQHGGLPVFGYPLTPAQQTATPDGTFLTQYFERARFELHPENPAPYDVLLGRIGAEQYSAQHGSWQDLPADDPIESCVYWSETQRNVCGSFLQAWRANGLNMDDDPAISAQESLALWGLPLTGSFPVVTASGETQVQWFERARFEQQPDGSITFGRLGAEMLDATAMPVVVAPPVATELPDPGETLPSEPPIEQIAPSATPETPLPPTSPLLDTPTPVQPVAPRVPNVPQPTVPCNTNVPVPAEGLQVWMADPEPTGDAVACVRLILNGDAINGANAMVYRLIGNERRPSIPQSTGFDGVASFIFYIGQEARGRRIPVEAVVTYRGTTYTASTEFIPR